MDTSAVSSAMAPISRTKLQDLPIEVLDYILMKAVVKKVMDRKLAKSVWLDYASRVIQPMRTVWSRWNCSLATNWFRIVLSRILSNKDPAEISVAAIAMEQCDVNFATFAKLGNQIFFSCVDFDDDSDDLSYYSYLMVFDVQDLFNCRKTIPLPVTAEVGIAACRQSNSIYLWAHGSDPEVLHLVPNGSGGFQVLYWPPYSPPSDFFGSNPAGNWYSIDSFSVLDDGNLLVHRCFTPNVHPDRTNKAKDDKIEILSVHQPNGFVVRNIKLQKFCKSPNVVMKSNGNFVYANLKNAIVTEVDRDGKEVRSSHWKGRNGPYGRLFLDSYDRVILLDGALNLVFLDAELNFICKVPLEVELEEVYFIHVCFYKETNELAMFSFDGDIVFIKLAL